jgi:hypothetical protein
MEYLGLLIFFEVFPVGKRATSPVSFGNRAIRGGVRRSSLVGAFFQIGKFGKCLPDSVRPLTP